MTGPRTLRSSIAVALRKLAYAIDDTPRLSRAEIDAKLAAIVAQPRRINRYTQRQVFSNSWGTRSSLTDPLVLEIADAIERSAPGLYAGNPDMEAALQRHRSEVSG